MNFAIFKLTFKKALNTPNSYDANMCMNQLMIEVNRSNTELIHNILKGCFNSIQKQGENIKKIRALMVLTAHQIIDRGVSTRNKPFIVNFLKCGLYNRLVELASFDKASPDPLKGERLFGDQDPVERKISKDFFLRLREVIVEWDQKFGVDKNGKVTHFRLGYQRAFEGAVNSCSLR